MRALVLALLPKLGQVGALDRRDCDLRKICPKIEKPQALTNIEGIIEKSQALMVARPDAHSCRDLSEGRGEVMLAVS